MRVRRLRSRMPEVISGWTGIPLGKMVRNEVENILKLADTLKKRYWMRIITPRDVRDQIWLEALPRMQADAANFSKVELILQARDLMPFAMQIYKPGGQDRDVYQFDPRTSLIDKGLDMIRDFSKPVTPLGYTFILEDAGAPSGPGAAAPR